MKKAVIFFLCVLLCGSILAGCVPGVPKAPDVVITVGELIPGTPVDDIPLYVTLDGQPVACRTEWIRYSDDGYSYMDGSDPIPDGYHGRVDVYYFLPAGVLPEDVPISIDAPGGVYDGTGEGATNESGQIEAWSHIQYELPAAKAEAVISVGALAPGMKFSDVPVSVAINDQAVTCSAEWIAYSEDGFRYLEGDDVVPKEFSGRVDVTYHLPSGASLDALSVSIDAPGGVYDGTGESAANENGDVGAWSHIRYDLKFIDAEAVITVGKLTPGKKFSDVPVSVTVNGEAVDCKLEWIEYDDGLLYLESSDTIPNDYCGRLDVSYYLPAGAVVETLSVKLQSPDGVYDGTGEGATNENGQIAAWSHVQFELGAAPSPTAKPTVKPSATAAHTHSWSEDRALSKAADCDNAGWKHMRCSGCSETYREEIPKLGHNFSTDNYVTGSCTSGITRIKICSRCEHEEQYTVPAGNHTWGTAEYMDNRTHMNTCTVCGQTGRANHTFTPGDRSGLCTGCNEYIIN